MDSTVLEDHGVAGIGGDLARSRSMLPTARFPRRILVALLSLAIVVTAATTYVVVGTDAAKTPSPEAKTAIELEQVEVTQVEKGSIAKSAVFEGEFLPFERVDLHPKVAGFLVSIAVDEGDAVTEGQVLGMLEVPTLDDDIARARAMLERDQNTAANNKAMYAQTHRTRDRIHAVSQRQANLVAQQEIDEADEREDAAYATWQGALSQVEVSRAELGKLLTTRKCCQIIAPFPGVVTRRYVDVGAFVHGGTAAASSAATPLVTIARLDRLRLSFPITESLVPRVKEGAQVDVHVDSTDEDLHATISRVTHSIERSTRTMEGEIDVSNGALRISPGMYASVSLIVERHDQVFTVPIQAVRRRAQTVTAFVIDGDGMVTERRLTTGLESPTRIEVTAGLTEHETIACGNLEKLKVGRHVTAKPMGDGKP